MKVIRVFVAFVFQFRLSKKLSKEGEKIVLNIFGFTPVLARTTPRWNSLRYCNLSSLSLSPFPKSLLAYYIEITSYLPQEDRNLAVVSELYVHLAKGIWRKEACKWQRQYPSWSCILSFTSGRMDRGVFHSTKYSGLKFRVFYWTNGTVFSGSLN